MSIEYGFYDSNNGDRRYNADQFSYLVSMLIPGVNGVFDTYESLQKDDIFSVTASGLNVTVSPGMAWVSEKWTRNTSDYTIVAEAADSAFARYDAVVIKVDKSSTSRSNSIVIVRGNSSPTPTHPDLSPVGNVSYLPLAYIYRPASSTTILSTNIERVVGTSECQWIEYLGKWVDEVNTRIDELEEEISTAGTLTRQEVQNMINASIGDAMNASY